MDYMHSNVNDDVQAGAAFVATVAPRVASLASSAAVLEAARVGERLMALWPLSDMKQLDNDAKYAENLQVRTTRTLAQIIAREKVSIPDAEFVYEGADEIPGRPQSVVNALLAANEAYDMMNALTDAPAERLDAELADRLGNGLGLLADAAADIAANIAAAQIGAGDGADSVDNAENAESAADVESDATAFDSAQSPQAAHDELLNAQLRESVIAAQRAAAAQMLNMARQYATASVPERVAAMVSMVEIASLSIAAMPALQDTTSVADAAAATDATSATGTAAADESASELQRLTAGFALLITLNEMLELLGLPRLCLSLQELDDMIAAVRTAASDDEAAKQLQAMALSAASAEWAKHAEDVLWDPEEAKRKAKEDDERKNREALRAKFAHIKDDPTKPEVEL